MAKIVEELKLTVTLRDGETDHNKQDIIQLFDKLITQMINSDNVVLNDSFQEEALDDLISINLE